MFFGTPNTTCSSSTLLVLPLVGDYQRQSSFKGKESKNADLMKEENQIGFGADKKKSTCSFFFLLFFNLLFILGEPEPLHCGSDQSELGT